MRSAAAILAILTALLIGSGCRGRPPWGIPSRPPPCTFNPSATKHEIVAHVNRFVTPQGPEEPLNRWLVTEMRIKVDKLPEVDGTLEVEAPNRLRIRAATPVMHKEIADIGSNEDELWFWFDGAKEIYTIRHEHVPVAMQRLSMPIPLDPDWLMEVLGVVPMNVDDFQKRPATDGGNWVDLVAHRASPSGDPVVRVVRVDLCYGRIVEHRVENESGELIASAKLANYGPDHSGQYIMPHSIHLEWPMMQTKMTLSLGKIRANHPSRGAAAWEVPKLAGVQRLDLGPPAGYADSSRSRFQEPLYERKSARVDQAARMDVLTDHPSAGAPPAGYSQEAWQSSLDRLHPEQESAPRPFPALP